MNVKVKCTRRTIRKMACVVRGVLHVLKDLPDCPKLFTGQSSKWNIERWMSKLSRRVCHGGGERRVKQARVMKSSNIIRVREHRHTEVSINRTRQSLSRIIVSSGSETGRKPSVDHRHAWVISRCILSHATRGDGHHRPRINAEDMEGKLRRLFILERGTDVEKLL
jgi:hypothetical protein